MRLTIIFAIVAILTISCGSDNGLGSAEEIADIEAYVARNNLTVQTTNSGLRYSISGPQNGDAPNDSDLAVFHLKQFLMDGTIVVETEETPTVFFINQILPGLREGLRFMRKGDTGIFLMPSSLAYGNQGANGVPPNTPLGFEIELLACHEDLLSYEISVFQEYLDKNSLTAQASNSGLHYVIQEPGEGDNPTVNSTVTCHYKGTFLDGTVFDESGDTPATFPLSGVIPGWREGIPLLKRGGKGIFLIPSSQAYGQSGNGVIPPNTPILFEVELVDFE